MNSIDSLALEIGRIAIGGTILFGIFWLAAKSPIIGWVLKVTALCLWGLGTVGVTLLVIIAIYLPREQYGAAIFVLILGGFISLFWFVFGVPALLQSIKDFRQSLKIWE
jgi:hypothetical protein